MSKLYPKIILDIKNKELYNQLQKDLESYQRLKNPSPDSIGVSFYQVKTTNNDNELNAALWLLNPNEKILTESLKKVYISGSHIIFQDHEENTASNAQKIIKINNELKLESIIKEIKNLSMQ